MASVSAAEEESENAEQQRTELEMLQSIYTNEELTVLKESAEYLVCQNFMRIYSLNIFSQFLMRFR
jgi:hypothetical protein